MRILIIGSEGTIGPRLYKCIRTKMPDAEIVRCDKEKRKADDYVMADINFYETLKPAFYFEPDIVFHLAGEVSRESSELFPNKSIETNVLGTSNVIQYCMDHGSKIVMTSTSEIYGMYLDEGSHVVEDVMERRPLRARNIYAVTNFMGEQLIAYYHWMYDLKAVVVRLFMVYGPGEFPTPYRSIISRFIEAALLGRDIHVHAGGMRSFCYVDEVVEGIRRAGLHEYYETFNLGMEEEWLVSDIAKEIILQTGSSSKSVLSEPDQSISLIKRADFRKAELLLGWKPEMTLKEGLKKTIEWQKEAVRYGQES